MSNEDNITRNDVPQVEELKVAILAELGSRRARSCEAVVKDVSSSLGLSAKQRGYKIKGSKTTLLENRCEKARSELKAEGLIEYPSHGKMKLVRTAESAGGGQGDAAARKGANRGADQATGKAAPSAKGEAATTDAERTQGEAGHKNPGDAPHKAKGMDAEPADESAHGKGTASAGKPKPTLKAPTPSAASRTAPAKPTGPAAASAAAENTWLKYRRYIPLSLVALGLALCLAQWGLPGAILGGAGLFLRAKDAGKGASGNPAAPKATLWAGAASILLGLVLAVASCSGSSPDASSNQGDAASPPTSMQEAPESADGMLTFKVVGTDWPDKSIPVKVSIEGETAEGRIVSDHREVLVGTTYEYPCDAGDYAISVAGESLVCNGIPFTASSPKCTFDGAKDKLLTLVLVKDEKALLAAQEAERQKEAEAAAQAEAERQAAEEAAAAAAAAAAVSQAENAAAFQSSPSSGGEYIGNVNTHKFHRLTCGSLPDEKNRAYLSSRDEAINLGYVPCKKCKP